MNKDKETQEQPYQEAHEEAQDAAEVRFDRIPADVTITDIELEDLKTQADEFKDKYYRLLAEMENTRKRIQKEQHESAQYTIQNVISEFLNPIDHFERALEISQQMSEEVKNWGVGFQMILRQLKEALNAYGVQAIETKPGDVFDPNKHEAVEMVETAEYSPGSIVETTMRGYEMKGRTIRPARVTVAKSLSQAEAEESNQQENISEKEKNSKE